MKKKALIIIPIIIIVAFIIILIPKSSNNIEETTAETSVPEPTATTTPSPIPTVEPTPTPIPSPTPDKETLDDLESENGITVNSTSDNVILGEDEYKGDDPADPANASISDEEMDEIVDGALEQLMKEHPDWFSEEGNSSTTNKSSDYVHVDGVVENDTTGGANNGYVFGQGDYSGLEGGTVY